MAEDVGRVVGEIVRKFSPTVFDMWMRFMHEDENKVDKTDRQLTALLKFIVWERTECRIINGRQTKQPFSYGYCSFSTCGAKDKLSYDLVQIR